MSPLPGRGRLVGVDMANSSAGHVYVVGNAGHGVVKIGYASDVERRLSELITGYVPSGVDAQRLVALRTFESRQARQLESALHVSFRKARLSRQGFAYSRRHGGEGWTEWFDLGRHALTLIDHRVSWLLTEWTRLDRNYAAS